MSELAQESLESRVTNHESRVTDFEPEILAFCCEH